MNTNTSNVNPYGKYRYIGLSGESQLAKCPNAQLTNSFLAQKKRFTRKTAIKFPLNSRFLKVLRTKSVKKAQFIGIDSRIRLST